MNIQGHKPLCVVNTACPAGVAAAELLADDRICLYLNGHLVGEAMRDIDGKIVDADEDVLELIDEPTLCRLEIDLSRRYPCRLQT